MGANKRGGRSKAPALLPFRQGDLDGLCGLYAIINALRRATRYEAPESDAWAWLFQEMMQHTDKLTGAANAAGYGVDTKPLWELALFASALLKREYDLPVPVTRPLKGRRWVTLGQVTDVIADATTRGGTGVLVGFGGKLDHWTVIATVSPLHFNLFDSARHRRVRQDACTLDSRKVQRGRHVIAQSAVFIFTLGG